jgi:hypothetical protein
MHSRKSIHQIIRFNQEREGKMFSNRHSRKPLIVALIISTLVLLLALGTQFALARNDTQSAVQKVDQNSPNSNDDGVLDVGVEWINDFPGTINDRSHWDESCDGLYYPMRDQGWTGAHDFHLSDGYVWETDLKRAALGGHEDTWVDNVDLAMICTHGNSTYDSFWDENLSSVYFGSTHNDHDLTPGDAYMAFGDKDLEWLAFDSCSVLNDASRSRWSYTFAGLHLLLGFKNTMYVNAPGDGDYWAYYMNGVKFAWIWISPPRTILQSWFTAVDYNQPSVTCARVLGEASNNYSDYLWGKGPVSSDPVVDDWYFSWDHCSSGAKLTVAESQPEIFSIPVYTVQERLVNQDYVRNNIAPAFGFDGPIAEGALFYFMLDSSGGITRTLQVDRITGSFIYQDLSRLWVPPDVAPTLPDESQAMSFLAGWYKNQGALLPGYPYIYSGHVYEVEELLEMQRLMSEDGEPLDKEVASTPTDVVLTFPRVIPSRVITANGIEQLDMPVYGAGGRMKAYLGGMEDIIGMQGGSRDVIDSGQMVNILTPDVVWGKFKQDPSLALPEVSFVGDVITYTAATLGYYEQPYLMHQTKLIPVWDFAVNSYQNGTLVAENVDVYVPAAEEFAPPQVTILSPVDGSTFRAGEPIVFKGEVTGGTAPYTFEWNSSSDGTLGYSLNIVRGLGSEIKSGEVLEVTVSLQATDSNGLISTATVTLKINPILWMPFINK